VTQTKLKLKNNQSHKRYVPEFAEAVGLSCEDEVVTLRFLGAVNWGEQTRQVLLDRNLAEQLSRLLNEELVDGTWAFQN
jgi:hypothetical protein